ncbi:MAG: ThiF family adenylyltransferase [Arcanobacterium sp.]
MGQSERLARLRLILGDAGLAALGGSTVMVVGLGGVGASCAEALARGGVGSLIVLDADVVEESNINRQALAFYSTIGRTKTDVMRDMIADINPDCIVHSQQVFLTWENHAHVFAAFPRTDYVIDCIDTISQKLAIAEWCARHEVPLVASMGAANKLDPCQLEFADIQQTGNCPMSTVVRRQCQRYGIENLEVLYSRERPVRIERAGAASNDGATSKAETLGSMSYMPPVMGQMLAGLVIRRLAGMTPIPTPPRIRQHADKRTDTQQRESAQS